MPFRPAKLNINLYFLLSTSINQSRQTLTIMLLYARGAASKPRNRRSTFGEIKVLGVFIENKANSKGNNRLCLLVSILLSPQFNILTFVVRKRYIYFRTL